MTSTLFTPIRIADTTFDNRIVVSPMCQYSAVGGAATDWHMIHLGHLALSGAALLMIEATAVEPLGRISLGCLGLYDDECEAALARVIAVCRRYGRTKLGIQLAHSGRKGSAHRPWEGLKPLQPKDGAWQTVAPSAIPLAEDWPTPRAFTRDDFTRIKHAFVASAERALRLDLDVLEIHAAHGYLLHEFLSPLSNRRTDAYGGTLEGRMRYPLEIFEALRRVWPAGKPLGARISGSDWVEGGWSVDDAVVFARELRQRGCDFVDVSSGGLLPSARIKVEPGYQVPMAAAVRKAVGLPTWAVGMITGPEQAEAIVGSGRADMIAMARAFLDDPRWVWHAAEALGAEIAYPPQYERSRPSLWRPGARPATTARAEPTARQAG